MKPIKNPISFFAVLILALFALALMITEADFVEPAKVFGWDVTCYYNYLPAFFKFHTLDFPKLTLQAGFVILPDGIVVEKTSMGLAFLYMPFYLLAWLYTVIAGLPNDPYSRPFALALELSAIVYFSLGLIFLRKVLLRYFNDLVSTLGLVVVFLGTNLVYYTCYEGPMSHTYVFCLVAALLWLVIKWHEKASWKISIALGLVGGVLTLMRPSTAAIVLFIAAYGIFSKSSLIVKLQLLKKNWLKIILMIALTFLIWVPQMLYWKFATGHYLFFSYAGERFFWDAPLIHYGFFSYRNGWLMYSPVMIFSLIGFFFMKKELASFRWAILLYFLVAIYIIFSWWCWWWVGIGMRSMIELYAMLAIPLCAFINWVLKQRVFLRTSMVFLLSVFMLIGLSRNWQYRKGMVHHDGMTQESYWKTFLTDEPPKGYWDMIKSPNYEEAKKGHRIGN